MRSKFAFVTMLFLVFSLNAYAVQLSLPELSAAPGSTITVDLSVDNATGIAGGDIDVVYDPTVLAAKEVKATGLLAGVLWDKNLGVEGQVKLVMASLTALQGVSGPIFQIIFEVKLGATGESPLLFADVALFDEAGNDISVTTVNGIFSVETSVPQEKILTITDATANAGEAFTVNVLIDDVADVAGGDIVLLYDPTMLSAESVTATDLLTGMFVTPNMGTPGRISISIAGTTGAAAGTGAILDISLKANSDASGQTELAFESAELYNEEADTIPVQIVPGGSITVIGAPPVPEKILTITDATVNAGQVFTANIIINDVADVAGADIVLLYNPAMLSAESVTATDLLTGMFVTPNMDTPGRISISIAGTTGAAAGTGAILDISLKANSDASGQTELTFESAELYNEEADTIPVQIVPGGRITVVALPPGEAKMLTIADVTGKAGEIISTTIGIDDLTGVAGGDIVLLYDSAMLSAESVTATDLLTGMFVTPNTDVAGRINISIAGTTGAAAGTGAILDLSFKAKEDAVGVTELTFESAELYDENAASIPVESSGGKITISVDVIAAGKLIELEVTTFMYGTHGLLVDDKLAYALQSSKVDLDQFVDEDVTVYGAMVHSGLDGGPPLVDVSSVVVLERVVTEHTQGDPMLALQAIYNEVNVHGHTYIDIWSGSIAIEAGQFLEFQVAMFSGNPTFAGSVDLHTVDNANLRDSGARDQNDLSAHPATDLSSFARDQWYHRKISLDALAGKTLDGVMIATDSNQHQAGVFRVYVDNIQITDGEHILTYIWGDTKTEGAIPITGTDTATGTTFAGTQGMSDYSVTIVGATPVTPMGKLINTWGNIKKIR